ncbi:helix-turn-helix transcriptional regulator [Nocardia aurantiaca]|uniref:Helix-turn-helix domain-containing protein n=1 Tax=Nocardia aurantiaca TaxID=2675850 RepID=A0A6I3KRS7_9NOCA|nr:helix-turn-helix transcriptional regulator [Nocardia aurantiaca]MTE11518.1 helix-turn-helix domain-containing protein [Nocardia aurantiaca]
MQFGEVVEVEMPTLAAFVKRLRHRRGWTQRELAQHAHIGIGTVQKLEQGDKVSVGDRALSVLAEAVCDDEHERAHLRALAGRPDLGLGEVASAADMAALLDQLTSIPAAWMVDWTIVAANDRYRQLFPGLAEAKSLPHWMFGDPRAKMVLPGWQFEATVMTGLLRHYSAVVPGGGVTGEIVRELMASSGDFRRLWDSGAVYVRRPDVDRRIWSPHTRTMIVQRDSLIPAASGWLVIGFLPGDGD